MNTVNNSCFIILRLGTEAQIDTKDLSDEDEQSQAFTISTDKAVDTVRIYFDKLAYGFVPHVHNTVQRIQRFFGQDLSIYPRYYRGIRTHAEFQITYVGDVEVSWWLDGTLKHTYTFSSTEVKTEKEYYYNTVGHVLQYIHNNPGSWGKSLFDGNRHNASRS